MELNQNAAKLKTLNQMQVKSVMRRSNCSDPIPPGQPRGQRKYACDKKGRGTRKKGDFGNYIGRGK